MIDIEDARDLLDYGARIGEGARAEQQLEGAVAIHNILETHKVAYLADEVGMGKTYVALGALALFRHFDPGFRVAIIAPRENIQDKWMKEARNFVAHNVRFPDLRVKGLDGQPSRRLRKCANLVDFVRETSIDRQRDFFLRLTSFSLPISRRETNDADAARRLRDGLLRSAPWLSDEIFDLRSRRDFKDNIARAVCCAIPHFDLVIVDEGHNLKHGFGESVASRNRVLALAFGHRKGAADPKLFPGYSRRATRVLFLSATPIEESFRYLWNQLDVFGVAHGYDSLLEPDLDESAKRALAGQIIVRRVTSLKVCGSEHTKNLYRREWRRGGVDTHDEPIRVTDPKKRLTVALVQKKVSELLGHERFGTSFQIGMLASFESFLQTAKIRRDTQETGTFDDAEQTERNDERQGIDVASVNGLARSFRETFDKREMPHPKMDEVVDSLKNSWLTGRKALVFVRRVASVKELKAKLDECYDEWLIDKLSNELPVETRRLFDLQVEDYRRRRDEVLAQERQSIDPAGIDAPEELDPGGTDTFFAWFFRGDGPKKVISGANIQRRFTQKGTVYSTFFEDNIVADVLSCRPGDVQETLAARLGVDVGTLRSELQLRSRNYLGRARKVARADRFRAVQAAAIEWLKDRDEYARLAWHGLFENLKSTPPSGEAPDIGDWLELKTFFTELRQRPRLRAALWPIPVTKSLQDSLRERVLRAQYLSSTARLGHAFIDLYLMTIARLGSLEARTQAPPDDATANVEVDSIEAYLDILERQMSVSLSERTWCAFDELAAAAQNFDLVLDVNMPDAREMPLDVAAQRFGSMLGRQQPIGGMWGAVSQTLVRQFRLPGYPVVLITTDVLQEGEDLHTFCSSVIHYGISWTPSSMEQRIGRIDRVRSETDRRLARLETELSGEDKLQVYFPYLEDTVEILQVRRVLERMNTFLRLMHDGIPATGTELPTINTSQEFLRADKDIPQISTVLRSAFPVRPEMLRGDARSVLDARKMAEEAEEWFSNLRSGDLDGLSISWEPSTVKGVLEGTATIGPRKQPFRLELRSYDAGPLVRCVSLVGRVDLGWTADVLRSICSGMSVKVATSPNSDYRSCEITVEGDVILKRVADTDCARTAQLVRRIVSQADELEDRLCEGADRGIAELRTALDAEASDES